MHLYICNTACVRAKLGQHGIDILEGRAGHGMRALLRFVHMAGGVDRMTTALLFCLLFLWTAGTSRRDAGVSSHPPPAYSRDNF